MSDHADLKDQVESLITPAKDVTNVTVDEKYDSNTCNRLNCSDFMPI